MDAMGPVVIVLVVIVTIVAIVISAQQAGKRRDELAALASRLGWRFDPANDRAHDELYRQFPLFRQGHSRAAYNTISGEAAVGGRAFRARMGDFLYKVTQSNGKTTTTTTHRFSYLILHMPWGPTPELRIRPEGLFDRLAGALGFDDIDFESSEFSRRFHVKCADKRFAYDVISPRMMELLLASGPVVLELDGGCCCLADGRSRWPPALFGQNLAWLGRFFEHWPDFLLEQLEGRRGGAGELA